MSTGTFLLLAFGLGTLVGLSQGSNGRADPQPRELDALRARAIQAQQLSACTSQRARELTAQWLYQKTKLGSRVWRNPETHQQREPHG